MKILHVTKKYPTALGGDAVVVANLQKQQQAAGHTVIIVTSNCDEIANERHVYKVGLKDTPTGLDAITLKRLISLLILFFQMFAILRRERPNIIHTHSVDMAFCVSFAAHRYHIPIIHTFHIVTFYDENQSALRRNSELWLAKKAKPQRVTAPNTYDVQKLQTAGLPQATLLPNGVDLAFWEPRGSTEKNREATFVSIGRLENQKGYDYLIKAAAILARKQPVKVIIVGTGSQETALRELAQRLHVEDSVMIVGQKTPKEISALLAEAHGAVFPSLYETTPLTLLEAWAAGMPVIATPVGILRDAPADFGAALIVAPKNERALATAMRRCMLDKSLRETVAAKGRKEAAKYVWPRIAQTLESIYQGAQ